MKSITGICIITPDVARLRDFYCALLQTSAEGDDVFATLALGGAQLSLCGEQVVEQMAPQSMAGAGRGSWALEIEVDDVDQEYERLAEIGAPIVKPPTTQPWGVRSVWFRDPDGNLVNCFARVRTLAGERP
jgi:catechol 2,3-dioxygenase-like lactoylglutathione lyase family enzyme